MDGVKMARGRKPRVVVIGAGVGGLVAAAELAGRGLDVVVLERSLTPGGKMRQADPGGAKVDVGPTVLTMRWVFDEIAQGLGEDLDSLLTLSKSEAIARHFWSDGNRLDLFADIDRSADAIAAFAGRSEAEGYRSFTDRARRIYETLEAPFIRASRPSLMTLARETALTDLWRISPFVSLWRALGQHFRDPRLRQLFGRYATYCGSSPFSSPATLMLVAHVEQCGVWLVQGGMYALAEMLAGLATRHGAILRYGAEVSAITTSGRRVSGVSFQDGEHIEADVVVANADVAALAGGHFGTAAAGAVAPAARSTRSLSAVTWALQAEAGDAPLARHNVFFSRDYAAEFTDILRRDRLPADPTVYVCAQDRDDAGRGGAPGRERLFCLVNAPPRGDGPPLEQAEIDRCQQHVFRILARSGVRVPTSREALQVSTPADFHRLFPGTGGALYGRASHGWTASFRRPGNRTRLSGLYLAGGSAHPGPGVPMAALSGRSAAASLLADWGLSSRSNPAAMPGGTSMRSATTAGRP